MNKSNQKCGGLGSLKPLKPADFTFTAKISDLPKADPTCEFLKTLKAAKSIIQYVELIQPDPNGPWELLSTNIPNFKLKTYEPFHMIKAK